MEIITNVASSLAPLTDVSMRVLTVYDARVMKLGILYMILAMSILLISIWSVTKFPWSQVQKSSDDEERCIPEGAAYWMVLVLIANAISVPFLLWWGINYYAMGAFTNILN